MRGRREFAGGDDPLSRYCQEDYNVVSCINLAFLEWMRQKIGKPEGARQRSEGLPDFSRRAVLHLYRQPPRAAREEVERYVQAIFDAVSRASAMAFKYEFTLETPLTIHTKWPYLPLEIGLAWHPILNVPYIPASSLKGAARAAAVSPLCGIEPEDLFGTTEEEGDLIFTDAYPTRWERLVEPDVITPHYRETAGEISEAQARPVPLVFPVVPAGTTFTFVVAFRQMVGQECWGETLRWLQQVLTRGLGAKTQLSYGVFRRQT